MVYAIATRRKWKCAAKACRRQFSATSQTIFASRKLPFGDLLLLMAHFVNGLKGVTAVWLSGQLEIHYKSAFVRLHKLREVLKTHQQRNQLRGKVEIDGAYFGATLAPRTIARSELIVVVSLIGRENGNAL